MSEPITGRGPSRCDGCGHSESVHFARVGGPDGCANCACSRTSAPARTPSAEEVESAARRPGYARCDECGSYNPPWFTDDATWRERVPEDTGKDGPQGFGIVLCPECFARRTPSRSPILLLDVDGVLNAVTDTDPQTWGDWQVSRANGFPIRWSPSMIAALIRISERVEVRWLTTWWDCIDRLAFLGLPDFEVANTRDEYLQTEERQGMKFSQYPTSWWKLPVAQRVYAEGRPVVWIDDDLSFDKAAMEWGQSLPKGTLLGICPATFRGITPDTIREIESWLDEREERSMTDSPGRSPSPTCKEPSPGVPTGKPGTRGYRSNGERLLCTLLADHLAPSHVCDEGAVLSSWHDGEWRVFRQPRTTTPARTPSPGNAGQRE